MFPDDSQRRRSERAKRVKIFQPMDIQLADRLERIHLLNLSLTGAMAHAEAPPAAGTTINLSDAEDRVVARIVWTNGRKFGLAFAKPLTAVQAKAISGLQDDETLSFHKTPCIQKQHTDHRPMEVAR